MAEKIVSIKIVANTDNAGNSVKKLAVEFEKLEKSQVTISAIEEKRNFLLAEQVKAASKLIAVQDKLNSSNISANFAIGALQSSFTKYKKEIQETEAALKALANAQTLGINPNAKTASGAPGARLTTPATPQAGFSFISGAGGVSAAKAIKEQETLAKATDLVTTSQKALKTAIVETNVQHKNMFVHIGEIIGIYRLYNATLNLTQQALLNIPKAGIALQQTQASVTAIFGGAEGLNNLRFLKTIAKEAGQSLTDLEEAYRSFAPSAVLAGASQEDVNKIFKDFSETATVLHLSTDQVKSLYLALEQMYAKTTVQSEEIKKQLGNTLPGAVEIGAKAWERAINAGKASSEQVKVSVADFMAAMKKNLVITKEFAPYFAEEYRKIFGGVDDSVFLDTRTKLFSNLQRVKTEYELFSRDLFSITEQTMNNAVKAAAGALATVRENLGIITQAVDGLGLLIGLRLAQGIGSSLFGKTLVEVEGVKKAVSSFGVTLEYITPKLKYLGGLVTGIFTPFTSGILVAGTALGGLSVALTDTKVKYDNFTNASKEQVAQLMATYAAQKEGAIQAGETLIQLREQSKSVFLEYGEQAITLGSIFSTLGDNILRSFSSLWDSIKSGFNNLVSSITGFFTDMLSGLKRSVRDSLEAILSIITEVKARFIQARTFLEEQSLSAAKSAYDKALNEYRNDDTKTLVNFDRLQDRTDKYFSGLGESILSGTGTVTTEAGNIISETLKPIKGTVESILTEAAIKTRKEQEKNLEGLKQRISITSVVETDTSETKGKPSKPSTSSISEARKAITEASQSLTKQIQLDLEKQQTLYSQSIISFAEYYNRKRAILEKGIKDEQTLGGGSSDSGQKILDYEKQKEALESERFTAAMSNMQELRNVTIEYYTATGQTDKALKLQLEDRYTIMENALKDQIESGNEGAKVMYGYLQTIKEVAKVESDAAIAKASVQGKLNLNAADQERINVLRNIGAISELTAAQQLSGVYEKEIELQEELIALDVKKLETKTKGTSEYQQLADDIDEARARLENFKLTSNTVGQYFQTQLTPAFTNAFTGFITGSLSAKEAFASFAQDILKRIADIAAQQLATQIIGSLFNRGSSFGSGYNPTTGLGNTSVNYGLANGGATVGLSSAANSILTSPTYFPNARPVAFASGGILAGEAGAEAVLPLKRTSGGKLGVETTGGANSSPTYNIVVNVEKSPNESSEDTGNKIAIAMMKKIAQSEIANANRPGNQSNKITTFG